MQRAKKPAVFLDRDGVLTEERSYVTEQKDLHVFSYTKQCIQEIKNKGYYAIVITNQSAVARGLLAEETLQEMNEYLLGEIKVDAIYYCPHHPEGIIARYARDCQCRKPEIGLLLKAAEEFDIDMMQSYMIGDRADDVLTGQKAGLKTILLESGYGTVRLEKAVVPDWICKDLRDVIELL